MTRLITPDLDQARDLFHHVTHTSTGFQRIILASQRAQALKVLQGLSTDPELLEVGDLFDAVLHALLHDCIGELSHLTRQTRQEGWRCRVEIDPPAASLWQR